MSVSLHTSFMRWVVTHTWDRKDHTPYATLRKEWMRMSGKAARSRKNSWGLEMKRVDIKPKVKRAESLTEFTTEQKVHLIFILNEQVSPGFQAVLETARFNVQLFPGRRILCIRSEDGSFERRCSDPASFQPILHVQHAQPMDAENNAEDEHQNDDQENGQRPAPQLLVQQEDEQVPVPQSPIPQEDEEAPQYQQQDEQGPVQEVQVRLGDDQQGVVEINQQEIKEDPIEKKNVGQEHDNMADEMVSDPVVVEVTPVTAISSLYRHDPTIADFLISLRAAVTAARFPGLTTSKQRMIRTIKKYEYNIDPMSIDNVAQTWSSIRLEDENELQRYGKKNSVIHRRYLEIILHTVILLNSKELDDYAIMLQAKIRGLDYEERVRLETVEAGLKVILRAVDPPFVHNWYPKEEDEEDSEEEDDLDDVEDSSFEDEDLNQTPLISSYIISMYASISVLGIVADPVRKRIARELLKDDIYEETISTIAAHSIFSSIVQMAIHAIPQIDSENAIPKKRYLEVIYELLLILNVEGLESVEATIKSQIKRLNYEPKIKRRMLKLGIDNIIMAVSDLEYE